MPSHLPLTVFAGALVSILVAGCTSVDTSLVAPAAGPKCQLTAAGAPASFGPGGGTGTMNITTTRDCTWSITAMPAWISVAGDRGGQGEAAIPYTVAPNPVPVPRSGSIAVGTAAVEINQQAAPCRFALDRSEGSVGASGGAVTVQVETLAGCNWSATSDVPWVAVSSGRSGDASGTVGLDVASNSGPARTGTLRIAGELFTVGQSSAGGQNPSPSQPPPSGTPPPGATVVQFEGDTQNVDGRCPSLTFLVGSHRVETNGSTIFTGLSCRDLERKDRRVRVTGFERSNGIVDATLVEDR